MGAADTVELTAPVANDPAVRRHFAIPAVLLVLGALGFAGLATSTQGRDDLVRVTTRPADSAASHNVATASKRLDLLKGSAVAPTPTSSKPPARAPRSGSARTVVTGSKKPVAARYCRPNNIGISSSHGPRWGGMHEGLDIDGSHGSPIRAAAAGRIVSAGYDGSYGNLLVIRHGDRTTTAYAHMSRIAAKGGRVKACDVIGDRQLHRTAGPLRGPQRQRQPQPLRLAARSRRPGLAESSTPRCGCASP